MHCPAKDRHTVLAVAWRIRAAGREKAPCAGVTSVTAAGIAVGADTAILVQDLIMQQPADSISGTSR